MKYLLICLDDKTRDALLAAARKRHILRKQLVENILATITRDRLIDAVLDDARGDDEQWQPNNVHKNARV